MNVPDSLTVFCPVPAHSFPIRSAKSLCTPEAEVIFGSDAGVRDCREGRVAILHAAKATCSKDSTLEGPSLPL